MAGEGACVMSAGTHKKTGPRGREPVCRNWCCRLRPACGLERSGDLQILSRRLAAIAHELEVDPLAFIQRAQPGALHCRDVHEHVLAAVGRLDEAVTFGRVEPLHSSASHRYFLLIVTAQSASLHFRGNNKVVSQKNLGVSRRTRWITPVPRNCPPRASRRPRRTAS